MLDFGDRIWYALNNLVQFTIQRFADQIEMLQAHTFGYFVVHLVDGGWPNARSSRKISLRLSKFAQLLGQENLNHLPSLLS